MYDYNYQYRKWNDGSDSNYSNTAKLYKTYLETELKKYPKNSKVLDYGCGIGLLVNYLNQYFDNVEGVDASETQVNKALEKNLNIKHIPIESYKEWIKVNHNKFDIIFLQDVLEHVDKVYQLDFLKELVKTLSNNGIIYIKVPNANNLVGLRWRYIDWEHTSSFTEHSLDFICHNAKLETIEYLKDETGLEPRYKYLIRPSLLGYYFKIIIRKLWKIYLKQEGELIMDKNLLNKNILVKCRKL